MEPRLNLLNHAVCILLALSFLLFESCGNESKPPAAKQVASRVSAPAFNGDSAFSYIQKQVDFGPRVPNSAEHIACGDWLAAELKRHGAEVIEQPGRVRAYDETVLNMRNIIGQFRPQNPERIMLYAHWDTRPFADKDTIRVREPIDGANDGGSGVGVLLEVARIIGTDTTLEVGVDVIFFDAEDYGCLLYTSDAADE